MNAYNALPPLSTQQQIAQYLNEQTARIDTLKQRVIESTERLLEYRASLITAAVTGQIKNLQ